MAEIMAQNLMRLQTQRQEIKIRGFRKDSSNS